jgi:hypothetical protein
MTVQEAIKILEGYDYALQRGNTLRGTGVTTAIRTLSKFITENEKIIGGRMTQEKMTVAEGAILIDLAGTEWTSGKKYQSLSLNALTRRVANRLSNDPIFNLAAYFKYTFPSMDGVDDDEWIEIAKETQKILGGK